jgi:hypothetical protein
MANTLKISVAASAPARRHVIRQSPDPIVATKTPNAQRAEEPRSFRWTSLTIHAEMQFTQRFHSGTRRQFFI